MPPVYALLLHTYLLSLPADDKALSILMNVLVDGAQALFWIDVSSNVVRLLDLLLVLLAAMALRAYGAALCTRQHLCNCDVQFF